ncbi:MAG: adenylate kinase [Gammaproteobacteria bacterium]|nr:adenylate kinase [Gammaproteobacteria bacterium]
MSKIIAIAGPAQSGKSTVATYLQTLGFTEDSFAAPIRKCVAHILGISLSQLESSKEQFFELVNCTPRKMMQTLGTEWGREMIQNDLWIVSLQERIKHEPGSVVISDLRFENEATIVRLMGAEIWHIERPKNAAAVAYHVSEKGIVRQPHDRVLLNDGEHDKLYGQIEKLLGDSNV